MVSWSSSGHNKFSVLCLIKYFRSQIRFQIRSPKVLLMIGSCGGESGRVVPVELVVVLPVEVVHSIDVWNPRVLAGTSGTARSSSLQSRAKETDFSPAAPAAEQQQQSSSRVGEQMPQLDINQLAPSIQGGHEIDQSIMLWGRKQALYLKGVKSVV